MGSTSPTSRLPLRSKDASFSGELRKIRAANLDGYVVIVQLGAHNENMVKDLESSFQRLVFFAPAQVRQYIAADAQAYEGPAISSHRLAQLEADPPASYNDPHKLEGRVYRNAALGFSYQV